MPLYEYQCQDCGSKSEFVQKAGDPHKKKCPKCGGRLSKLLSAPAIQFKGGGWYITDYSRKSGAAKSAKESKDKGAEDAPKKSEEKKSDSTPSQKKD